MRCLKFVLPVLAILSISLLFLSFVGVVSASSTHTLKIYSVNEGSGNSDVPFIAEYYVPPISTTSSVDRQNWTYVVNDGWFISLTAWSAAGYHFDHYHVVGWETVDIYDININLNVYSDFEIGIVMVSNVIQSDANYTVTEMTVGDGTIETYVNGQLTYLNGGVGVFPADTNITFNAVPYYGQSQEFHHWVMFNETDDSSTTLYTSMKAVMLEENITMTAYFSTGGAVPSVSPTVRPSGTYAPSPTAWGDSTGYGLDDLGKIVLVILLIGGLPMAAMVGAPKIGMIGFMFLICTMCVVGVMYNLVPSYFMVLMGLGIGLMFYTQMHRDG